MNVSIKRAIEIAEGRAHMLTEDLARLNRDGRFSAEHKTERSKAIRAEHEDIIVGELRQARQTAIKLLDHKETVLSNAQLDVYRVADRNVFETSLGGFRAQLRAARLNELTGESPVDAALALRETVQRAGSPDEVKALRQALLEIIPAWESVSSLTDPARELARALQADDSTPAVEAAAEAVNAARADVQAVDNAARRITQTIDVDDFRQSINARVRTRLERMIVGDTGDVWLDAGVLNVPQGVPTGQAPNAPAPTHSDLGANPDAE